MDVKQLRYFLAVAEELHFGRAARRMHVVQSALSMQIRALEEELGGPLFTRTSRKVELTQAGLLLLEEARRTLSQLERTKTLVQRSLRGEGGQVRVGFAGNAVLAGERMRDLRAFRVRHPEVALDLQEMAPQRQGEAILLGLIDVGYSPSLGVGMLERLSAETIGCWPFLLAMADIHPLARHKRVSLRKLAPAEKVPAAEV